MTPPLSVCVAGATGWTGRALIPAILISPDLRLAGAVARRAAGEDIGTVLGGPPVGVIVAASVADALREPVDVLIDYTTSFAVRANVNVALARGVHVVIGTSGLTNSDYLEIERVALEHKCGVIAGGNFSITAALVKHFAAIAAAHMPDWEIIDYAHADKVDVPSGVTRELAEFLTAHPHKSDALEPNQLNGPVEARGAGIAGTRVHSIRLPSYTIAFEVIFGRSHERLTLRHDAGPSAEPYVSGTLLAVRRVSRIRGLIRGLDQLLFGSINWSSQSPVEHHAS